MIQAARTVPAKPKQAQPDAKPVYNHAFTLAFQLKSNDPDGEDVTEQMLRAALLKRLDELDEHEQWDEAVGAPFDTYEVDTSQQQPG